MGSFDAAGFGLQKAHPPETELAAPDMTARYDGLGDVPLSWQLISATPHGLPDSPRTFAGVSTTDLAAAQGPARRRSRVFIESDIAQPATLLVGSDDACEVWLNGASVHRFTGGSALQWGADRVPVQLTPGRHTLIMKVFNGQGAGGLCLSIESLQPVRIVTENESSN